MFVFDERSGYLVIYSNSLDDIGWYVLQVTATLDVIDNLGSIDDKDYPADSDALFYNSFLYSSGVKVYGSENPPSDLVYEASFNITVGVIEVNETSVTESNTEPYMLPPPDKEIKVLVGRSFQHEFGRIYDFEGDDVTVELQTKSASSFVRFDPKTRIMTIPSGAITVDTQPILDVKLILTDSNEIEPLSKEYDIKLVVVKD